VPEYDIPIVRDFSGADDPVPRRIVVVVNPRAGSLEYMGPLQVFDEARIFLEYSGRLDRV